MAALFPEWGESATAFSSPIEATGRAAMWEAYADPAGSDRATIKGDEVGRPTRILTDVSFKHDTTIEAALRRHSMSRYPHLAFQTLKAADLRINASEAGRHMASARTAIASHISIAIRLRQNSYVDAPAARALQVYGPSITRDHGSILLRWSDVDHASVSSFAMITLMVGLID